VSAARGCMHTYMYSCGGLQGYMWVQAVLWGVDVSLQEYSRCTCTCFQNRPLVRPGLADHTSELLHQAYLPAWSASRVA
jgi:hypothetical protein